MTNQVVLGGCKCAGITHTRKKLVGIRTRENSRLKVMLMLLQEELFEAQLKCGAMMTVGFEPAREIVVGDRAFNRLPQNRYIVSRARNQPVQAEGHMTLEHFHLSQPSRRPSRDPLIGPLPPGRLNTADPRRLIFPFDNPVQGSAAGLVQMDKDQRVAAGRGCRSTRGL